VRASALAAAAVLLWSAPARAQLAFDLMHTRPECSHASPSTGVKMPSAWCLATDRQAVADRSGMEKRVAELLDLAQDPARARITIAYFSFSNPAAFEKLCQRGKAGIAIEGYFDRAYAGADQFPGRLRAECQGPGGKNVRSYFLGKTDTSNPNALVWRLHHNKFLLVDPGDGSPVRLSFSSGNLSSSGLSLHFDHWGMIAAPGRATSSSSTSASWGRCATRSTPRRRAWAPRRTTRRPTGAPWRRA
jgi:hypothetical protein